MSELKSDWLKKMCINCCLTKSEAHLSVSTSVGLTCSMFMDFRAFITFSQVLWNCNSDLLFLPMKRCHNYDIVYGDSKVYQLEGVQSQSESYREQMKLPNMERVWIPNMGSPHGCCMCCCPTTWSLCQYLISAVPERWKYIMTE